MDVYEKKGEPNRKLVWLSKCLPQEDNLPSTRQGGWDVFKKNKTQPSSGAQQFLFLILHDWDQLEFKQALAVAREGSKLYQFKEDALLTKKMGNQEVLMA